MGNWELVIGNWELELTNNLCPMPYAPCPMPHAQFTQYQFYWEAEVDSVAHPSKFYAQN